VKKLAVLTLLPLLFYPALLFAGDDNYVGVAGGFSVLSGDGRSVVNGSSTAVSLYKPETGPAVNGFVGRHLSDYLSLQGNYVWNGNGVTFTSAKFSSSGQATYQEDRSSSQQSAIGDLLLYFRKRKSFARPYLSVGAGFVRLTSTQTQITSLIGPAILPPRKFTATRPALRVAVGIDLALHKHWSFRYSFSEALSANPLADQLSPPGQSSLKNFQNLFGFVRSF